MPASIDKEMFLASGEKQLKNFGNFLENHRKLIKTTLYRDEENYVEYFNDISKLSLELAAPINLVLNAQRENLNLFQLIETDNKILNKTLIVFAKLCLEIKELTVKSACFQKKLLFYDEDLMLDESAEAVGHVESNSSSSTTSYHHIEATVAETYMKNIVKLSKILNFLFEIKHFLMRCLAVAHNLLQQLGGLYENEKQFFNMQTTGTAFQPVFNYLGDVMLILVNFDEILSNSNIAKYWPKYIESVQSVNKNLDQFNNKYDKITLNGLLNVLNEIRDIFNGNLLHNAIELFSTIKSDITPKAFGTFTINFQSYIKMTLADISKYSADISDYLETTNIIKINIMSIIYHNIFGNLEQKLFKNLIELNQKYCSITLVGNTMWLPFNFIKKHSETLCKGYEKVFNDVQKVQQIYLQNKVQNLQRDTHTYCYQITTWILKFTETINIGCKDMKMEHLRNRCTMILHGLQYAGQISHLVKSITNLHILLKHKMQKGTLMSICKLIEFLKLIHLTFQRNVSNLFDTILCIIQHLQYQGLFIIATTKKKILSESAKIYNEKNLDMISALQIIEKCFYGPGTQQRILVIRLAVCLSNPAQSLSIDYLQKFEKIIQRLDGIVNLQENVKNLCEPTFLYWHQSMLPIYLKQVMEQNVDVMRMMYLISSTNDCRNLFLGLNSNKFQCLELLNENLNTDLKTEVIQKICNHIETYLRLDFHSNLQVNPEDQNPFKVVKNDYHQLIKYQPIQISDNYIIVKDNIENYLNNMFYNLTTISLHDWKTYGEMRQLAMCKYNLNTVEDHLPQQTLEQGLDVLEIMRNIHIFVSKYLYNLNNQIFVERSSNNKHLNTINIRHIANSLRTHGTGIINTTVNFTYQFLRKKFFTFSQFMFDEHIKSRLMKDLKYFRDSRDKNQIQFYSYERAEAFNKGIKKLGLSEQGQSYLDLFRLLISHIGNAMGYVRMMRSGSLHSCSNASVFLPVIDDSLLNFKNLCTQNYLSKTTCDAADNLEFDIKNLSKNYSDVTDYFKLLVDAFAAFFRNPKNIHLKNFYLIVPPLTINFIDHILTAKDKMSKKNKNDALFTDDGFAMGIAYILKLLDQMNDFNSLHWFKSIRHKYNVERENILKQREQVKTTDDEKLQQTLLLTEKRIIKIQQEYDLLYCNLSSARIFFK